MRASLTTAVRGIGAGVSALAFVSAFLLTMTTARAEDPTLALLVALVAVGVASLLVAGGPSALNVLLGREGPSTDADGEGSDWWLANLEPALEGSWTRWSDLVLGLGMAGLGIGSFVLLATTSHDDPPAGLLVTGFLGVTGAMIVLPWALAETLDPFGDGSDGNGEASEEDG